MVRQDKSRAGRVTPKAGDRAETAAANREPVKIRGAWIQASIPYLMFGLMIAGTAIILANYVVEGLGAPSNWYLLLGLALILFGIILATQYR